ncbi:MAG TPA: protein-tyrosine phosphatase family protein [Terriglobia bacterium]|nr:protein-tyrosine phosphatase family protein [Terriglobia bacterium]
MRPELYWIGGPWPGKLALAGRPRGGDWLDDEVQAWKASGIGTVVSFLTRDEATELGLEDEARLCNQYGISFVPFPVVDRSVPQNLADAARVIHDLEERLNRAQSVALHCRQGIGRSATVASCLLVSAGLEPEAAFARVGQARGCEVPETAEQRNWVIRFARELAPARP